MKPSDVSKLSSLFGLTIDPKWLAVVAVLVPVVVIVIVVVYKRVKARGAGKKEANLPSPTGAQAPDPTAPAEAPKLREAWLEFLKRLPSLYRRSILNFEHYVVLGDSAHGKSRLIDVYTDWQRQQKQFLSSNPDNPELPVYITSSAVVMEIPAKVLRTHGQECKQALTKLWKPLYEHKTPVAVVAVHAQKMLDATFDEIQDLGETLRGKINLLASIRDKPIEVRVVLTNLDAMEGYTDVAALCRNSGMPLRVPLRGAPNAETALAAWLDGMKAQLPRALLTVDTAAYGRILRFLNGASRLIAPVRHLYTSMFAHEALSVDPIRGDLYLASQPAGNPNPLAQGDRAPGPDPRLPHLIAAAVVAGACMTLLGITFAHQYSEWSTAKEALKDYVPNAVNPKSEVRHRLRIIEFTQEHDSYLDTHPDFFAGARHEMRKQFTDRIRQDYLIPRLREVAQTGAPEMGQPLRAHQRSLYFLGLIHSGKNDVLSIRSTRDGKDRDRLVLWSTMTGIEPDFIRDYLNNTDEPDLRAVVGLEIQNVDAHDTKRVWQGFIDDVKKAMADDVVTVEELEKLRNAAKDLEPQVARLRNADITLDILPALDQQRRPEGAAADDDAIDAADESSGPSNGLARKYAPAFGRFLDGYEAFRFTDVNELSGMLATVRDTGLAADEERGLLTSLLSRLSALYRQRLTATDNGRMVQIDWEANSFDELAWHASIREAKAHMMVESFTKTATERDIFFDASDVLVPTTWNPTGSAAAVFVGRRSIDGRFTREMYETRVRRPVLALSDFFDNVKMVESDRKELIEFVRKGVQRYAANFRTGMIAFIRGFDLTVSSPEELRVALTQMSAETGGTSFDEFLKIVDRNTRLNAQSSKTGALESMLVPAHDEMKIFDAWHGVVDQEKGAPRIIEYKKILQQLLIDLGGSLESAPAAEAEPAKDGKTETASTEKKANERTLETELTPTGRVFLASIVDRKGAYWGMIRAWLQGSNLPSEQQSPFLLPLSSIETTGRRDVENAVERSLQRELMLDLERIVNRFPFDRTAREEVTPQELTDLFHPKEGRVFDFFRRYLEPVSEIDGEGGFRIKSSIRGVRLSKAIYDVLNASALLSSRLWDDAGKPRTLDYRLITVPFNKAPDGDDALTLVYLNVGEGSLFNFNQKHTAKTMSIDWTKTGSSQVGVQLTNTETKENSFPRPIGKSGSYFSFLRLLTAAEPPAPVKEPPTAQLYTWQITLSNNQRVSAQVVVKNDPWDTFTLGAAVRRLANR
ncbi:MAG: hypothetical protein IPM54_37525 [Polyangiaceae bacterium]|nr:hypothetical protein [Polyangiaceae bacterium]